MPTAGVKIIIQQEKKEKTRVYETELEVPEPIVEDSIASTEIVGKRFREKFNQKIDRVAICSQLVFLAVCFGVFLLLFYPFTPINASLGNLTLDLRWLSYPVAFLGLYISVGWIAYTFVGQLPIGKKPRLKKFNPHGPLVSVLIAARNEEKVIQNIIGDLERQTYPFWEAIIIAHNCDDSTFEKAMEKSNSRVKVLRLDEGYGKPIALNYAVKYANGEYIAVFDADSRIKPDFLEKIAPYLRKYDGVQARIATSNTDRIMPSIIDLEWVCYTDLSESFGTKTNSFGLLGGTGQIVKRSALEKCGYWDEKILVEDYDLSMSMMKNNCKIGFAHDAAVYDEKPTNINSLLKQRARWLRGNLQILKKHSSGIWKLPSMYHLFIANAGIFIVLYGFLLNGLHLLTGMWYNTFYFEFWWILWLTQIAILWFRAAWVRKAKGALLFPLFYIFSFHWLLAFVYMFKVKTWKESKTEHFGASVFVLQPQENETKMPLITT